MPIAMSRPTLALQHSRTLSVSTADDHDLVEIHGAGGEVELRIKVTPEGPVLLVESVRLALKAKEDVSVECGSFEVRATDSVDLHSDGGMQLSGEAEIRVNASGDVRVVGEKIYLN